MKRLLRTTTMMIGLFIMASSQIYYAQQQYTITLVSSPECGGLLNGAGTYNSGTIVPLSVTLLDGYKFDKWTYENGELFSTEQTTSITLNSDKTLVANFTMLWKKVDLGIYYDEGRVGIGTDSPDKELTVNGTIHTTEVLVSALGADFVFENTYDLKPLSEVENFIKKNKHLPEIPSAEEMKRNGMDLGEMGTKLLQKIEELTLHIIAIKKENERLNETLKKNK